MISPPPSYLNDYVPYTADDVQELPAGEKFGHAELICKLSRTKYMLRSLSRLGVTKIPIEIMEELLISTFTATSIFNGKTILFNLVIRSLVKGGYVTLDKAGFIHIDKIRINQWFNHHKWEGCSKL